MLLHDLVSLITTHPFYGDISVDEFLSFVRLAKLVRPAIELSARDITNPPERLSTHIYEFLGAALGKSFTEVQWFWYGFKTAVWSGQVVAATPP